MKMKKKELVHHECKLYLEKVFNVIILNMQNVCQTCVQSILFALTKMQSKFVI